MASLAQQHQAILKKLRQLPPDKLAEVEDFVDFLRQRAVERELVHDFARSSESVFEKIWDNPDDAAYDQL